MINIITILMINIPKTVNDPFYRYRRPIIEIEKQKNGSKVKNLNALAKSMYLEDSTIIRFLQKKLGCQSKEDILLKKDVNVDKLDNLFEELVLLLICIECNNPEMQVCKENQDTSIKCLACGNSRVIDSSLSKLLIDEIDQSKKKNKITTFIDDFDLNFSI